MHGGLYAVLEAIMNAVFAHDRMHIIIILTRFLSALTMVLCTRCTPVWSQTLVSKENKFQHPCSIYV